MQIIPYLSDIEEHNVSEALITLVSQYPNLYVKSHPQYKDRTVKNNTYKKFVPKILSSNIQKGM